MSSSSSQRGTTFDQIIVEPIVAISISVMPSYALVPYVDPTSVLANFEIPSGPDMAKQAF